jgi:hypothetical protein
LSIVLDANALVVLALDRHRASAVEQLLHVWANDPAAVVSMTQRLERKSAYDAAYIVLAEQLSAGLWTLDGPLARNAHSRGLPVKLIETP